MTPPQFHLEDLYSLALRTFVFEGVNGSGKSTALRTVAARLRYEGHLVQTFADPGSHDAAKALRVILKSPEYTLDSLTQVLMFTAARRLLLQEMMDAHLTHRDTILLVDRWVWSTLAYQCAGGVPPSTVLSLYDDFCPLDVSGPNGATAFLLDIEASDALARTRKATGQDIQEDRFESAGLRYLDLVVANYRMTRPGINSPAHIDATCSPESVALACYDHIHSKLHLYP